MQTYIYVYIHRNNLTKVQRNILQITFRERDLLYI